MKNDDLGHIATLFLLLFEQGRTHRLALREQAGSAIAASCIHSLRFTTIGVVMKILAHKVALLSTAGALMVAASMACAATTDLPPVQRTGAIDYVTGGIGQAESSSIERASHDWPLTLEFAIKDRQRADFVTGVEVEVRDARQQVRLKVKSDGPFLLAKLAPGHYQVDATFGGKSLHEKIVVTAGHPAKAVFVWPSEKGEAGS